MSEHLLGLRTYVVDFDTFDPTAAPRPGRDGYASLAYNLMVRFTEGWERVACGAINGAVQRAADAAMFAAGNSSVGYARGVSIGSVTELNKRVSMGMRERLVASLANGTSFSLNGTEALLSGTRVDVAFSDALMAVATELNVPMSRNDTTLPAAAMMTLLKCIPVSDIVPVSTSARLSAATVQLGRVGAVREDEPSADGAAPMSAAASAAASAEVHTWRSSAPQHLHALSHEEERQTLLIATSGYEQLRRALFLQSTPASRAAQRQAEADAAAEAAQTCTVDEWLPAMQLLANAAYEVQILSLFTHDYIAGNVSASEFSALTSRDAFLRRLREPTHSLRFDGTAIDVLCLDPTATTYSPDGDLHQAEQCLYSTGVLASFERMNLPEWILFLLQGFSSLWLSIILGGCFLYLFCCYRDRMGRCATAPIDGKWPHIAVLVPCYMPNEEKIIDETLEAIAGNTQYAGQMDIILPYNTPHTCEIEAKLAKTSELHGHNFSAINVPGSTSKAHNLVYALEHLLADGVEYVIIFDADHHPRADTVAKLIATLIHPDSAHLSATQGSVHIERGGPFLLRHVAGGMEWANWVFWAPGFSVLAGSAYFGGGNAAWRRQTLTSLGFDSSVLTEDIDLTIRALTTGHTIEFVPWAQVGEMCPATFEGFYKQRLRWAMGWEQVTYRRFGAVFNATTISEPRKWRIALLLTLRYWSITTALISVTMMGINTTYRLVYGTALPQPPPLMFLAGINQTLTCFILSGQLLQLFLFKAPWWRWLEVFVVVPISVFYFLFQLVLIFVSWWKLGFAKVEWVPTKREANDSDHALDIAEEEDEAAAPKKGR